MTTTETPIGLADIAGISSAEEGRAVALALYNKLPRWIEITDDSDTWPPQFSLIFLRASDAVSIVRVGQIGWSIGRQGTHWRPI